MTEVTSRIAWLESQIDRAENLNKKYTDRISSGEATFADKLSAQSNESLIRGYKTELRREKELFRKEVLEFRLIGDKVDKGTLPLNILAKIADKLNKAIHYSAYFIRTKKNPTKGVDAETKTDIDLRLSGLLLGSCNLQIIGNVQDDLAGDSLLGDAYNRIFKILSEEENLSFSSIAPTIGNSAVHNLDSLLEDIEKFNIALEMKWNAPNGKQYKWGGSKEDLRKARLKLEKIVSLEPVSLEIHGTVTDLSTKGRISIQEIDADKPLKIKFTADVAPRVETLTLNDNVTASITRKSTLDEVTGEEKHTYELDQIFLNLNL